MTKSLTSRAKALYAIHWYNDMVGRLLDDPMTEAYGAPVGDFCEVWARKHRQMLADCLKDPNNSKATRKLLLAELERYMP